MNGPAQAGALLFIGLNYAPEPVGIGPFTCGLAEGLAMRGHAVRVITGRPYYPQWQAYDGYSGGWNTAQENGVTVTRCPHYIPAKPSGLKRVAHLTSFAAAALIPALGARKARPRVVICTAPALLSVPVAWLAAKLAGAKLWIHVQDFEVEAAFATGLIGPSKLMGGGPLARLARWLESGLER